MSEIPKDVETMVSEIFARISADDFTPLDDPPTIRGENYSELCRHNYFISEDVW